MEQKHTISIIDDDREVLASLRWLIESVGYNVETYNEPQAFLAHYRPEQPGCLILDVRMPEQTGPELQEILLRQGISIPIIFITAHGDVPLAVRAMKNGAVDFLTKPVNNQILLESINRALKRDQFQRQNAAKFAEINALEEQLTPREHEVMLLMVKGKSTKAIAEALGISPNTAELHRAKVMKKMRVKTVAELVSLSLSKVGNEELVE